MSVNLHRSPVVSLGARARAARGELGLTQAQLAEVAHVSRSFVNELESGHPRAELGKVLDVMGALGLELAPVPRTASAAELTAQERASALSGVLTPHALHGFKLDSATRRAVEQYIDGHISIEEAIDAISSLPVNETP